MTSIQINNKLRFPYIPMALIGLLLLVVAKDLIHASIRSHSFYLSESLLFGLFWLIFVPFILISKKERGKYHLLRALILSLSHLGIFSISVSLISMLFFNHTFGFSQTFINTATEYGIVCILVYSIHNFLYVGCKEVLEKAQNRQLSTKIKVLSQNRTIVLDCQDIVYIKSEKPYIALVTKEKSYLYASTLKSFLEENASQNFIQIHKSTIVNTDCIVSYTSRKNGDYDIVLGNEHCVRASRSFNKNFRPFLRTSA